MSHILPIPAFMAVLLTAKCPNLSSGVAGKNAVCQVLGLGYIASGPGSMSLEWKWGRKKYETNLLNVAGKAALEEKKPSERKSHFYELPAVFGSRYFVQ